MRPLPLHERLRGVHLILNQFNIIFSIFFISVGEVGWSMDGGRGGVVVGWGEDGLGRMVRKGTFLQLQSIYGNMYT